MTEDMEKGFRDAAPPKAIRLLRGAYISREVLRVKKMRSVLETLTRIEEKCPAQGKEEMSKLVLGHQDTTRVSECSGRSEE